MDIRSQSQLADLLTKALNLNQFSTLLIKMGISNIHSHDVHLEGEYQRSRLKDEKARLEVRKDVEKEERTKPG